MVGEESKAEQGRAAAADSLARHAGRLGRHTNKFPNPTRVNSFNVA